MSTCVGVEGITNSGLSGLIAYPTTCDYYFYGKIMAALWIIIAYTLFRKDEEKVGKGDMLSAMGVSAIAVIFLSLILTTLGAIPSDEFIEIIVAGGIFIAIWILK